MFTMPELSESNKQQEGMMWERRYLTPGAYKNAIYLNTQSSNHSIKKQNPLIPACSQAETQ